MMKQILPIAMLLLAGTAWGQAVSYEDGKKMEVWAPSSNTTDIHVKFKNITGAAAQIAYSKVSVDFPSGWDVSFCDDLNCYITFVDEDTFMSIANNTSTELKISVTPNGKADTAKISYALYDITNPSVRDTFEVEIFVPWGASVSNASGLGLQVSPNPVNNQLSVQSTANGVARIIDIRGVEVLQTNLIAGSNQLDVSNLATGMYFLFMETPSGRVTERINKL